MSAADHRKLSHRPGDTAKPVAERGWCRSKTPWNLPHRDASECNFHEIREMVKMFAAGHGKTGCGEAPTLLSHFWFECGGAGSRETS